MTKTKKELIREVADATGITQRDVAVVVATLFQVISDTLKNNQRIELRGFGVFSTRQRKPREARNPRTGEIVRLPARVIPVFKPSKFLKK